MVELIYCASGNKRYAEIAIKHGSSYGAQLPNTVYIEPAFADQNWKNPDFDGYMVALEKHKPRIATVLDWDDRRSFDEVMHWANTASQFVKETVIIIPKVCGTIPQIPRTINGKEVRLGYSIPTSHGGTEVPIWEFLGRPVHLLGGSPQKQLENMRYLPTVKSADGNYMMLMAQNNQFFTNGTARYAKNRYWAQLQESGIGRVDDHDCNYLAFELSCLNFRVAVQSRASVGVRWAVENDIPSIEKIARQYDKELGFVSRVSLKERIKHRELYIAEYGRDLVGFVNWHKRKDGWHTIYEIAVRRDRQGENIGKALLASVANPLRLKCTVDNEKANAFYASQGMNLVRVEQGRKRELNVWEKI